MTNPESPEWMPSGTAARLPCGRWWDAVELSAFAADDVFESLYRQDQEATALRDRVRDKVVWLIRPGAADGWQALPWVAVRGAGESLQVPPAVSHPSPWGGGPALSWTSPPTGSCLTDPDRLFTALVAGLLPGSIHG